MIIKDKPQLKPEKLKKEKQQTNETIPFREVKLLGRQIFRINKLSSVEKKHRFLVDKL